MAVMRSIPLYKRIAAEILRQIRAGLYPGGTLPSEGQLSESMSVSKHTVREALTALNSLSFISKRHGIGNRIMHSVVNTPFRIDANTTFFQLLGEAGYQTRLELTDFRKATLDLGVMDHQSYYVYNEVLYADDTPATHHQIYIPAAVLPTDRLIDRAPGMSLFDFFASYRIIALHSIVEFVPEIASAEMLDLFGLPDPSAINTWDEIIYDNNDQPICLTKLRFNPVVFPLRVVRKDFEIVD